MSMAIEKYLDRVMTVANLDEPRAGEVRRELRAHVEEKAERLRLEDGLPPEDAVFKAIEDHGDPRVVGHGLRPKFPWLDVRTRGTARGVIAIGPRAVGVFAFGGMATGVFACGGIAIGAVTWGGIVLAALFAWGGIGASLGAGFIGVGAATVALGGFVLGVVASGGMAIALWVAAAGTGVSYYDAETVPAALTFADAWMTAPAMYFWASVILVVSFLILLTAGLTLQERERRRLLRADPTLAD